MRIIENKALLLSLQYPERVSAVIPNSKLIDANNILVKWGVEEAQVLKNLRIKNVPSPILGRYSWPGMYQPFAHQKETAAFLTMNRRAFVLSEQGTGKTGGVIWAADYLLSIQQLRRVLIVCPLSIMQAAWQADLFKIAMHRSVDIAYGSVNKRKEIIQGNADFVIINYDGVEIVEREIAAAGFDLIVVDECFVAGTQVRMGDNTYRDIEGLKAGDKVLTSNGVKPIKRLIHNTTERLVKLKLTHGPEIVCTPEHPFFTDVGWVTAKNLTGRRVVHYSELPHMRGNLSAGPTPMGVAPCEGYAGWPSLLSILRSEEVPHAKSGDELLQSDTRGATRESDWHSAERCVSGEHVSDIKSGEPQTTDTWGERNRDVQTRENRVVGAGATLGMELPGSVGQKAAGLSYELQAGLRQFHDEGGVGGRWELTPYEIPEGTRQKESLKARVVRVESVSHIKPTSPVSVYNIEVEGTPNYFIGGGVLVHNCNAYKTATTKRWKAMNRLVRPETWLWMMTGTPAAQSPIEAYGLAKLANPKSVPPYFGTFKDMVMHKVSQFRWVPKPNAAEVVHTVLQPAIRHTKKECSDLPDMTYVTRDVELTPQQKKFYDVMKKKLIMQAAGEEVTSVNAAVNLNKLLQISAGAVYSDTGEVLRFDIANRYKILREVIDETDHKVLIFAPFRHVIDVLREKLEADDFTVEVIRGDVSAGQRSDIFRRFQETADPRILVIQPQAAAHGVTLTAADTVVWWGPTPSLEIYAQANARAHRTGQKNPVTVVRLQGSTAERHIYKLLDSRDVDHTKIIDLYNSLLS